MPLSSDGNKIKKKFKEEYGDEEGEGYFYAKERSDPKFSKLVRKGADPDSPIWWLLRLLNLPRNN